jgi:hypothetical protein
VIVGEYARSGTGLALTALPLALAEPSGAGAIVLAAVAALFLVHGGRAVGRHLTSIEVDDVGIARHALGRRVLCWRELRDVRLRYYSTRRDRSGGWLELRLTAGEAPRRRRVRIDSSLDGFEPLARRIAAAARERGLAVDAASAANFAALGIPWPDAAPSGRASSEGAR